MNDENLIPLNRRPTDEAREIQRQGGKASGEARRRKAYIRAVLLAQMGVFDDYPELSAEYSRKALKEL